jgi:hypothetical protein
MMVLLTEGLMEYGVEMTSCGMMHVPSIMKIGIGVQAILRFSLRNLRDFNVGITDGWIYELCC